MYEGREMLGEESKTRRNDGYFAQSQDYEW